MPYKHNRIVIAGTNSGVGKTTIVTGIVAALANRGLKVQPFKVGPDYIDPGFHELAANRPSYNLDTWLVPEIKLTDNFAFLASDADVSIIEGVMGLYDGGANGVSSTAQIAKLLKAPVVLVVNAQSMGQSVGALVMGYKLYDSEINLAGVILNMIGSDRHEAIAREEMERLGVEVLGVVRRNEKLQTPERHLGLTPVEEIDSKKRIDSMREAMELAVDFDRLLEIAGDSEILPIHQEAVDEDYSGVKIGVAKDEAFSFYYPTSLRYLTQLGVELVEFSPLNDEQVPDVDGLIFGGGFPEMFLEQLSRNSSMKDSICKMHNLGIPIYAECGGLMYLCRQIVDFNECAYDLVGLVPAIAVMQKKLQRVGYVTATALEDSILCSAGDTLRGHEFHFSLLDIDEASNFNWAYQLQGTRQKTPHHEGFVYKNLLASYLHLAFDGNALATKRFLDNCKRFSEVYRWKKED